MHHCPSHDWDRYIAREEDAAGATCAKHRAKLGIPGDPEDEETDCEDKTCAVGCPFNLVKEARKD